MENLQVSISQKRVLIACGGSGGHLAPGIALAQKLTQRGHHCELLISQKTVDKEISHKYPDLVFHSMPAVSLGKTHSNINPLSATRFALSQLSSLIFCARVMRRMRPDAVVGFGGFSTVSAGICAKLAGTPLFLHEANHKVGKTIRVIRALANTIYIPEGADRGKIREEKIVRLGIPLRDDMENISRDEARALLAMPAYGKLLFVTGGSQGAKKLNDWVEQNLETFLNNGINVYCVMGPDKGAARVVERTMPNKAIVKAIFVPFSHQMNLLYAASDLVVARAGAGTIAELIKFRTPSILVPLPYAADRHQHANAAHIDKKGGSLMLDETKMEFLAAQTLDILQNDTKIEIMRECLAKIDQGEPALVISQAIEKLEEKKKAARAAAENLEMHFRAQLVKEKIAPETIKLSFNEPIGPNTTFGIGGPAKVYAEPTNAREIKKLFEIAKKNRLPVFILGRGSNLLVLDKGFDGLVLRLNHADWQKMDFLKNGKIKAWAGVKLKALCAEACKRGMEGFEFMEGIPATLGGALYMNAGAFNGWTFERVERVGYLTVDGRLREASGKALKPTYRSVIGLKRSTVLWAILKPRKTSSPEEIKKVIDGYQTKRKATQPREASAGCVFKNPTPTLGAGKTIDEVGLKGFSVGTAAVSEVHANFIINKGKATAADVISLINQIRERVWASKKIDLEPEIMLLGGEWKDYLVSLTDGRG